MIERTALTIMVIDAKNVTMNELIDGVSGVRDMYARIVHQNKNNWKALVGIVKVVRLSNNN
jgi:hypothetical protein